MITRLVASLLAFSLILPPNFFGANPGLFELSSVLASQIENHRIGNYPAAQNGFFIFHLEDAHENRDAQERIEAILGAIVREHGVRRIYMEGASGTVDPSRLRLFEDPKAVESFTRDLLNQGELSGVERFLVLNETLNVNGYGLEDAGLYRRDLEHFRALAGLAEGWKDLFERFAASAEHVLLESVSGGAQRILKAYHDYQSGRTGLIDYARFLRSSALRQLKIDLSDPNRQFRWPMTARLIKLMESAKSQETGKFRKAAAKEREALAAELEKSGQAAYVELLNSWFSEDWDNAADLSRFRVANFLSGIGKDETFFREYPHLARVIGLKILRSEIDPIRLEAELTQLTEEILAPLCGKESAEKIFHILGGLRMLKHLYGFELTRAEYETLKEDSSFQPRDIAAALAGMDSRFRINQPELDGLEDGFREIMVSYDLAVEREEGFYRNIQELVNQRAAGPVVTVAGGFHTSVIEDWFRQNRIPYVVITPKIRALGDQKDERELYLSSLLQTLKSTRAKPTYLQDPGLIGADVQYQASVVADILRQRPEISASLNPQKLQAAFGLDESFNLIPEESASVRSELRDVPSVHRIRIPFHVRLERWKAQVPKIIFRTGLGLMPLVCARCMPETTPPPTEVTRPSAPAITQNDSVTQAETIILSGTKSAFTSVWINGEEVYALDSGKKWSASVALKLGENIFTVSSRNEQGGESIPVQISLIRVAPVSMPSVVNAPVSTTESAVRLEGTKPAGTSIWINGTKIYSADGLTTWWADVDLNLGINTFTAYAEDSHKFISGNLTINITREDIPVVPPPAPPTVTNPPLSTMEESVMLEGTKPAGTSIWINGKEAYAPDSLTVWEAWVNLEGGNNLFAIVARDNRGIESEVVQIQIERLPVPDTTPPTGSVTINNGDAVTNSRQVMLQLHAEDDMSGVTEMQFSEDGVTWTEREPFNSKKDWTLSEGNGLKTVYVRFYDGAGNRSVTYSATIRLEIIIEEPIDTTPPTGSVTINNGAAVTDNRQVTLELFAEDDMSGVTEMQFSEDEVTWTEREPFNSEKTWTLPEGNGLKTVYVRFYDGAGNRSVAYSATIQLEIIIVNPPAIPTIDPFEGITEEDRITLSGRKEKESSILINGVVKIPVNSAETWSVQIPLSEGLNEFWVTSRNSAGKESVPAPVVQIMRIAPVSTLIGAEGDYAEVVALTFPGSEGVLSVSGVSGSTDSFWMNINFGATDDPALKNARAIVARPSGDKIFDFSIGNLVFDAASDAFSLFELRLTSGVPGNYKSATKIFTGIDATPRRFVIRADDFTNPESGFTVQPGFDWGKPVSARIRIAPVLQDANGSQPISEDAAGRVWIWVKGLSPWPVSESWGADGRSELRFMMSEFMTDGIFGLDEQHTGRRISVARRWHEDAGRFQMNSRDVVDLIAANPRTSSLARNTSGQVVVTDENVFMRDPAIFTQLMKLIAARGGMYRDARPWLVVLGRDAKRLQMIAAGAVPEITRWVKFVSTDERHQGGQIRNESSNGAIPLIPGEWAHEIEAQFDAWQPVFVESEQSFARMSRNEQVFSAFMTLMKLREISADLGARILKQPEAAERLVQAWFREGFESYQFRKQGKFYVWDYQAISTLLDGAQLIARSA